MGAKGPKENLCNEIREKESSRITRLSPCTRYPPIAYDIAGAIKRQRHERPFSSKTFVSNMLVIYAPSKAAH
jgi:hypothetical protein